MSRQRGRVRLVVHIKPENYLTVQTALTPAGASKPGFGVISDFIDGLIDEWVTKRAQRDNQVKELLE